MNSKATSEWHQFHCGISARGQNRLTLTLKDLRMGATTPGTVTPPVVEYILALEYVNKIR